MRIRVLILIIDFLSINHISGEDVDQDGMDDAWEIENVFKALGKDSK